MRSSSFRLSSAGISLSRMIISRAEASVTSDEIIQVKRIMITMPFSILSSTKGIPSAVFSRMPTITIAIAPAA